MGYTSTTVTISGAKDAYINGLAEGDLLSYTAANNGKWTNLKDTTFAKATGGGKEAVTKVTASAATTTLDLNTANVFDVTADADTTLAFSNASPNFACSFTVYIRQGSTAHTVSFPAGVFWSGTKPTVTAAANAIDIFVFESIDGGTTWFGSLVGNNFTAST